MQRGFEPSEFKGRVHRAQSLMRRAKRDALLLTTEADVRYFTGFLTRFWESPTRPWFVIVPVEGKPIAVIPSIGAALMHTTWIDDIRTWRAPDYVDDGIACWLKRFARLGRKPLASLTELRHICGCQLQISACFKAC